MNNFRIWTALAGGLFCLACVTLLPAAEEVEPELPKTGAILIVKNMCCGKESKPAIKELSKIPGVKRVTANHKKRTLLIEAADIEPDPRAIWDAADRVKIKPLKLTTPEGVFAARPDE